MVSFERFARPAILKMGGHATIDRPLRKVIFRESIRSDGRETYVRAIISRENDGTLSAISTGNQGSHVMTSLVKANGLVIIPEGTHLTLDFKTRLIDMLYIATYHRLVLTNLYRIMSMSINFQFHSSTYHKQSLLNQHYYRKQIH